MSRPVVATALAPLAVEALKKLGENLALARVRRKESQRMWAKRIGVSIPTLIRMEQGEPTVGIGVYVSALGLLGRAQALPTLAAPEHDRGALELDVRRALERRRVRTAASSQAQLGRKRKQ